MSLLIFLAVLGVLIIVHEWGHYISARKLGITVEQFSVGFGPKLFSWKADGTEFMVCAIPLGGFVKLAGDDRTKLKGARDEFYSRPVGHRAIVIAMGPVINIVFAYLCLYVLCVHGLPVFEPKIGFVKPGSPAQTADLRIGDRILKVDNVRINNFDEISEAVLTSSGGPLTIEIQRGTEHLVKIITPHQVETEGVFKSKSRVRMIGVGSSEDSKIVRYSYIDSFGVAAKQIVHKTSLLFKVFYRIFSGAIPAQDALAGPIKIFGIISLFAQMGFFFLLYIMAEISLNLAIFNLFPVPVLDGGHLLFLAIEKIRGKPLSLKFEENLTKVGLGLLLALMLFVMYNDINSLGWFTKLRQLLRF